VRGRKRHILVDTEGPVVEARMHSAKGPDQDGIRRLLDPVRDRLPRLSYLWADAGYWSRGKEWAEEALGVEVEIVNRSPKPPPEKVLRIWAREWFREGREMDLSKLPKSPAFENLPRRWVAERSFAWISHNRRMAKNPQRLCPTGEAFIHAADGAVDGEEAGPCMRIFRRSPRADPRLFVRIDECGVHTSMARLRARVPRGERAYGSVPRNLGKNTALLASMTLEGAMGECMAVEGSTKAFVFEAYVERFLAPALLPGRVV
jgi:transposase